MPRYETNFAMMEMFRDEHAHEWFTHGWVGAISMLECGEVVSR
jgi:hypothetical protein